MKRLGIILLFFLCTLSATAQLPYNHEMTQADFDDASIMIQKQPSSGVHSPSCDASGNIYLGGTSTNVFDSPAWNWDEKYVIIALREDDCSPNKLSFKLSLTNNAATLFKDDNVSPLISFSFSSDNMTWSDPTSKRYTIVNWLQKDFEIPIDNSDTRYVKLSYEGNFAAIFSNLKVISENIVTINAECDGEPIAYPQKNSYPCGNTVQIEAPDVEGYCFFQWSDGTKTQSREIIVNPTTTSYTAQYVQVEVNIKSADSDLGLVYFEDDGISTKAEEKSKKICPGTSITVVAVPKTGKSFSHWESGGEQISTDTYYKFSPTNDINITAVFNNKVAHSKQIALDDRMVDDTKEPFESESDFIIEFGSSIDRDFPCYRISKLLRRNTSTNEEEEIEPTSIYRSQDYSYVEFEMPTDNISYIFTLVLTPIQYHIKVYDQTTEEEINELSVSKKYDCEKDNTYTFNEQCYEFKKWDANYTIHVYDEDEDSGVKSEVRELSETEQNNPTLTIPSGAVEDITFKAYVTKKQYTISVTIEPDEEGEPHGSVNIKQGDEILTNPATIPCGAKVTLTAIPETCYEFVEWTKENDPDFKDSDNPLETDDTEDAKYIAHFQPIGVKLYLVTLDDDKKGVQEELPFDYNCGQEYTLKPIDYIKDPCLTFYRWRVEPEGIITGADEDKITIPSELEHSITIYLDAIPKTFTASVSVQPELDSEGKPKKDKSDNIIYHGGANITKVPRDTDDNTEP